MDTSIIFPNLHITLNNIGKGFYIGSFFIAFYGMIIALGMLVGVSVILKEAKRVGFDEDSFLDICIITIIVGVIGARIYYVIFAWDYYKDNPISIFNRSIRYSFQNKALSIAPLFSDDGFVFPVPLMPKKQLVSFTVHQSQWSECYLSFEFYHNKLLYAMLVCLFYESPFFSDGREYSIFCHPDGIYAFPFNRIFPDHDIRILLIQRGSLFINILQGLAFFGYYASFGQTA